MADSKAKLNKKELIGLANYAMYKELSYEELNDCDSIRGHSNQLDEIWDYVIECREIGTISFYQKYKHTHATFY